MAIDNEDERRGALVDLEAAHLQFLEVFFKVGHVCNQVQSKVNLQLPTTQEDIDRYLSEGKKLADYFEQAASVMRNKLCAFEGARPYLRDRNRILLG